MPSEAQKKATKKYQDKFERVMIRVPKEDKDQIIEHAASMGESPSAFIKRAIQNQMENDKKEQ